MLRGTAIHKHAGLKLTPLMESFLEPSIRKGLVSKAELQERDFKRLIRVAIEAHEKRLNFAIAAVGQKGHMRLS